MDERDPEVNVICPTLLVLLPLVLRRSISACGRGGTDDAPREYIPGSSLPATYELAEFTYTYFYLMYTTGYIA